MPKINVALADIPISIDITHEVNIGFFKDYISDRKPIFEIAPSTSDLEKMEAALRGREDISGNPSPSFVENNTIHRLIADRLVEEEVLLMHGSALAFDGEAVIFTAPSGTGKSIHAALWRRVWGEKALTVNDDKPLLSFRKKDEIRVYGTPWNGKHRLGSNTSAPLRAISKITRSKENKTAPLPGKDAFTLVRQQCLSTGDRDLDSLIFKMEIRLLSEIPFYEIFCDMSDEAAITAHDAIFNGDGNGD